jgi:hypothetical protein
MKNGRIIPNATGEPVEVEYELWVTGLDDAGGRIRIGDDPTPGDRFMGDPASVAPGDLTCILETATGGKVHIFFKSANGTFVCQFADEAREALAAGG